MTANLSGRIVPDFQPCGQGSFPEANNFDARNRCAIQLLPHSYRRQHRLSLTYLI